MRATLIALLLASASLPVHADDERGAYASAIFGNGIAYQGNTSGDRTMKWRALEVRIGRDLDAGRVDFVHYNEGHPDNNHRDGFAFQAAYARALTDNLSVEIATGPYLSMNTTEIGGVQVDDSNLGLLSTLALRYRLPQTDGLHLRLGFNHVAMRDVHSSNALLFGVGRHFTDVPPFPETEIARSRLWLGASIGNSVTNQSHTDGAFGGSAEAKWYGGKWALSVAGIVEGDDGTRVDRRGAAALFWFVQPINERWALSAGMGPYYAENRRDQGAAKLNALITMQAERSFSEHVKAIASFGRVKTFGDKNDRDLFRIGVLRAFGQ